MQIDLHLKQQFQAISTLIRRDSIGLTTRAGSGHPTTCLSAADLMTWLFFRVLRLDAQDLDHPHGDKYIFSKGHGAPLLYALLYRLGYLNKEELLTFREIGSRLEGHPTTRLPGVVAATGSLGQGLSIGAGMAAVYLRQKRDQRVYVLLGDGEINEGQIWEAAMSAADQRLSNLVAILDRNKIQQSNTCHAILNTEPLAEKFQAFGWNVVRIDGHDPDAIIHAFAQAVENQGRPFMIVADTEKGKGVSFIEGKLDKHGKPLTEDEKQWAFQELALDEAAVNIEGFIRSKVHFEPLEKPHNPIVYTMTGQEFDSDKLYATREAYGTALKILGQNERVWVMDGDVSNSTLSERFAVAYPQRHIEVGIAEQNMIGTAVGVACTGQVALANSFARFFERAYDQIEMGAYSGANFKVVGSHVGISIGADGTSQMALADCGFMRSIPGAVVVCPSDFVSAFHLTHEILNHPGFCYMRTCRNKQPVLYDVSETFPLGGLKVLRQSPDDSVVVVACGYVLHEAVKAVEELEAEGMKVCLIDAYSLKPFPEGSLRKICLSLKVNRVFTLEDHYLEGGLGDAVLQALNGTGLWVEKLAVKRFPESGDTPDLLAAYEIDAAALKKRILNNLV